MADAPTRRGRLALLLYATAGFVYLIDRLSKVWAENDLQGEAPIEVVGTFVWLHYTTNSGGAFGIGESASLVFVGATVIVVGIIVWTSMRLPRAGVAMGLGLVLGGALGNLTDRAVRGSGFRGGVVDFVDVGAWPVFNVADAAIVVGAIVLLLGTLDRARRQGADGETPDESLPEDPGEQHPGDRGRA
ncbi:MAG: signal peptidase II [Actinomycetota bacterium]